MCMMHALHTSCFKHLPFIASSNVEMQTIDRFLSQVAGVCTQMQIAQSCTGTSVPWALTYVSRYNRLHENVRALATFEALPSDSIVIVIIYVIGRLFKAVMYAMRCMAHLLALQLVQIDRGGNELIVVDQAIAICISSCHDRLQLRILQTYIQAGCEVGNLLLSRSIARPFPDQAHIEIGMTVAQARKPSAQRLLDLGSFSGNDSEWSDHKDCLA